MLTERLSINQIKYPLDEQADWLNDPRNTKYSEQRWIGLHDRRTCSEYVKNCSLFWGIQLVDTGDWIGTMSALVDEDNNIASLGILIHHEYAAKGYGTEAWKAACDFLLRQRKVRKVEAGMMDANIGMKRLCIKTGMVRDGEQKHHFLLDGHPMNLVYYAKWPQI